MLKMKDVKKTILEQRPVGTGSCIGESFNNYTSPVKIGGTTSMRHSPKNRFEGLLSTAEKIKSNNSKITNSLKEKAKKM
jgi:hypothetical protein